MPKPNPLTQGLSNAQSRPSGNAASTTVASESKHTLKQASRTGRVLIGGHFAPEVQTALKIIAAEERTTMQSLLAEAINTVFAKRHKPEIAEISWP